MMVVKGIDGGCIGFVPGRHGGGTEYISRVFHVETSFEPFFYTVKGLTGYSIKNATSI